MTSLCTAIEARAHLRIDDDADDEWLAIFIPAISEAVAGWLKDEWRLYVCVVDSSGEYVIDSSGDPIIALDSSGSPTVRSLVKAAMLVELASAYRFREGEGTENTVPSDAGHGYVLNKLSTAMLSSLRKTTVA